ncbi:MAG TPA: ribonuclease HI [Firmicutes bacterium]|nr:ribonuclease HI [Bacillota bacterium]
MVKSESVDKAVATIYTDGACSGNPGPGGWAAVIINGEKEKEIFGADSSTTNQRMELTAAIKALEQLPDRSRVELFSDSAYLINAFRQNWFKRWEQNGWLNAAGKPVKNKDLWIRLQSLNNYHLITWRKLAGHSGDYYNERCDQLAREAIKK